MIELDAADDRMETQPMIEQLLPHGVEGSELFADPPDASLFPEEAAQIERAVAKRRAEYASVRHCARTAMGRLGVPSAALVKGDKGAPQWPRGVVGSMTHTDGYRAAALGFSLQIRSVGIDAEQNAPLPDGVLRSVSLPQERERIAAVSGPGDPDGPVHWDRLLFSAKESTYKAWFPLAQRWLGFADADIEFMPGSAEPNAGAAGAGEGPGDAGTVASGRFRSRILVPGHTVSGAHLETMEGRWLVAHGLVVTAIVVV